jgi:hypothetical protein
VPWRRGIAAPASVRAVAFVTRPRAVALAQHILAAAPCFAATPASSAAGPTAAGRRKPAAPGRAALLIGSAATANVALLVRFAARTTVALLVRCGAALHVARKAVIAALTSATQLARPQAFRA